MNYPVLLFKTKILKKRQAISLVKLVPSDAKDMLVLLNPLTSNVPII